VARLATSASREELAKAIGTLVPALHSARRVLLVDERSSRESLAGSLAQQGIKVLHAANREQALALLRNATVDCMVLALGQTEADGLQFLAGLEETPEAQVPVIVYTGYAAGEHDGGLSGKTVLVVDDDLRATYALSSMLRGKGMEVLTADTGQAALDMLDEHPGIDLVLIDVMMPEMDGHEATRRIRQSGRFRGLPVIALTARATQDDRAKCLEAGASDYLSKPVDAARLLSMLHRWLAPKDVQLT
jgi:CheY-like chemotaxis protein